MIAMALTLRPARFLSDDPSLATSPANISLFEVDGLPSPLFARVIRAGDVGWRTQWAKYGERIESLPIMASPEAALAALEDELRRRGAI